MSPPSSWTVGRILLDMENIIYNYAYAAMNNNDMYVCNYVQLCKCITIYKFIFRYACIYVYICMYACKYLFCMHACMNPYIFI